MQFWSGSKNQAYEKGRELWISQLLKKNPLLPIAGSDAHGDMNRCHGVSIPLLKLKVNKNHLFGRTRTLFPSPSNQTSALLKSMQEEVCTCTNGPFASLIRLPGEFQVHLLSTPDFGAFTELQLYRGKKNNLETLELIPIQSFTKTLLLKAKPDDLYLRVEASTKNKGSILTSALFIDTESTEM